jgi:hypothetical protein
MEESISDVLIFLANGIDIGIVIILDFSSS